MANEFLRDRIHRKMASLPDERLYQVLDFVEFLESRYAAEQASTTSNLFQRFAEGVEDKLRAGRVSATTIAETMNRMHKAVGVLNGVAAAGKSVANDIVGVATQATQASQASQGGAAPGTTPAATTPTTTAPGVGTQSAGPGGSTAPAPAAPSAPPAPAPSTDRGDRPA